MPVRLQFSAQEVPPAYDVDDDDALIAAVWAAVAKLDQRRGKAKAAEAFRATLLAAATDVAESIAA